MRAPRQLPLDLPARESRSRGDFLQAPSNALALRAIEAWRDWPEGRLMLVGPEGAGKSHLTRAWADLSGAREVAAAALADSDIAGLATGPVAVEDADRIAGDAAAEEALFHLYNAMASAGLPLLITARGAPRDWGLGLADLHSRLATVPITRIEAPDEALLAAVLVKLFEDRQIAVAPNVITYLVPRMERSLAAAARLVAEIDHRALSERRPVGIGVARAVLKALDKPGQADA